MSLIPHGGPVLVKGESVIQHYFYSATAMYYPTATLANYTVTPDEVPLEFRQSMLEAGRGDFVDLDEAINNRPSE